MCPSDLLLLDEPTNHLDLDSILWLEKWLKSYQGTLVVVSHDREFLDQCVQQVVEIENKKLTSYKGNYSIYEVEKANAQVLQQAQFEKQQKQIAHMEDFVRRFKAKATKAKQAQSRVKALERMERILPAHSKSPFSFEFFNAEGLPNCLMRLDHADLGYGKEKVINQVNIELSPESRIGILGLNGSGKSTLLKSLVGDLELISGEHFVNEKTRLGYFSQHQLEALDLNATPLVHINRLAKSLGEYTTEQKARTFLGSFGFHGDRVHENIAHFSGGEKSRLALSLICWTKPNILILDEPTNHLDMEMRHALTMALQKFNGALIVVSHDRHLIRCTTDELYLVHQGNCSVYEGDIDNYSINLDKSEKGVASTQAVSIAEPVRLSAKQSLLPLKKKLTV
jgi:ATP-binding cassette subfamily F protein 3